MLKYFDLAIRSPFHACCCTFSRQLQVHISFIGNNAGEPPLYHGSDVFFLHKHSTIANHMGALLVFVFVFIWHLESAI